MRVVRQPHWTPLPRRASGSRLGQSRAWRLPSRWVVEYRRRNQDAERSPRTDSYLGFLLCFSVTAKLPSDWPDLLTFCLHQCPKLFSSLDPPVCSCRLSLFSLTCPPSALSLSQPELSPFKHTHPFTQQATNNKSRGRSQSQHREIEDSRHPGRKRSVCGGVCVREPHSHRRPQARS